MEVFSSYKDIPANWHPIILTIGKFDAIHLGHCDLLQQAKEMAILLKGHVCVLTFVNHPVEILKGGVNIQKLCTGIHKRKLLSECGVDAVIQLEFTREFAQQTAEQFIQSLHDHLPFTALVLGYDARLGSDRQANAPQMQKFAEKYDFMLKYAAPIKSNGVIISTSLIRDAILQGDLHVVEKMLGRKYSILAFADQESSSEIITVNLKGLCLPPPGLYPVTVCCENLEFSAQALIRKDFPILNLKLENKLCAQNKKVLEIIF